jgi:hypothetical protein
MLLYIFLFNWSSLLLPEGTGHHGTILGTAIIAVIKSAYRNKLSFLDFYSRKKGIFKPELANADSLCLFGHDF